MPIEAICPACEEKYRVKDELVGKRVKCKACGTRFKVIVPVEIEREFSPGGSEVIRHEARMRDFEPTAGDTDMIERVSDHIERHLGPVTGVFHEIVSDLVHLDIHIVGPTQDRPFNTLVTTGMSERPMCVPEGAEELRFAELMVSLPPDWPLEHEDFEDERHYWPVRWLKQLARLPHEYETWLAAGHTVPNGDPPEPFARNTQFCCWLVVPPMNVADDFSPLAIDEERSLYFYSVVPLYREEMDYKLQAGAEELLDRFDRAGIGEVIDLNRKNVCRKRLWFF